MSGTSQHPMNSSRDGRSGSPERALAHELILEALRYVVGSGEPGRMARILESGEPDWGELAHQAIHHKCVGLCWAAISQQQIAGLIPGELRKNFRTYYEATRIRNRTFLDELCVVLDALGKAAIPAWPLKGSVLIPTIYKDLGARSVNDVDLLIAPDAAAEVTTIMKSLGYRQARFDKVSGRLVEPLPGQDAVRQSTLHNLIPFHKDTSCPFAGNVEVDFSVNPSPARGKVVFADRQRLASRAVSFSIGERIFETLGNEDFLVQLCLHLYKEATRVEWLSLRSDNNLIKFVDVAAFCRHTSIDVEVLIATCEHEDVAQEVATVLRWTRAALGDDSVDRLLKGFGSGLELANPEEFFELLWSAHRYTASASKEAIRADRVSKLERWAAEVPEGETNAAAAGSWQARVTEAWNRTLRHPSTDASFFDLGGDSLDAMRFVAELEGVLGAKVPFSLLASDEGLPGVIRWCSKLPSASVA